MSRPTLHLTNLPSKSQHGPGRRLCAMAAPRHFERGDGWADTVAPMADDLRAVKSGAMRLTVYRLRYEALMHAHAEADADDQNLGMGLAQGNLDALFCWTDEGDAMTERRPVRDGDTLFCACARPDSPKRTHPCHLEWLAPFLVEAGWDVVLYGRRLTWHETPGVVAEVIWADTTAPYPGGWEAAPTPRPSAAPCDETAHYRSLQ